MSKDSDVVERETRPSEDPVASLLARLTDIVGPRHVLTTRELTASYEADWTRRWHGRCLAVVRPADLAQVVAVVRACHEHGIPIVPQGGNTGLVGGFTPDESGRQIVLSPTRLNAVGDVEPVSGQITVGAGAQPLPKDTA